MFLIIIAAGASYSGARMVREALLLQRESADMRAKIEQLKIKKKELEAELAEMQTKEMVEWEAKERMNLKKPGEEVVVVVPEKKEAATVAPATNWWVQLKAFFSR